jgi:hypothetical protein
MLARQINPGRVQEFMRSYEDATSRPHGYLMLDLKPTTDDQQRLKTNVIADWKESDLAMMKPRALGPMQFDNNSILFFLCWYSI